MTFWTRVPKPANSPASPSASERDRCCSPRHRAVPISWVISSRASSPRRLRGPAGADVPGVRSTRARCRGARRRPHRRALITDDLVRLPSLAADLEFLLDPAGATRSSRLPRPPHTSPASRMWRSTRPPISWRTTTCATWATSRAARSSAACSTRLRYEVDGLRFYIFDRIAKRRSSRTSTAPTSTQHRSPEEQARFIAESTSPTVSTVPSSRTSKPTSIVTL